MTEMPYVSWGRLTQVLGIDKQVLVDVAAQAGRLYEPFDLRKPGTTKRRHIDNPDARLKGIQRVILKQLLLRQVLPETIVGGVPGRSIRDNAQMHVRKPVLVTIDLRNCFAQIDDRKVFKVFRNRVGCSDDIAGVLTRLTTFQSRLPQGAPTSPALANLVMLPLHEELQRLARLLDLSCSFYVDDISISGLSAREAIEPIIKVLTRSGHPVARSKVRVMGLNEAQKTTGAVVNRGVSVSQARRSQIRAKIFAASFRTTITESELSAIWGAIRQVKFMNLLQGAALERYAAQRLPAEGTPGGEVLVNNWIDCKGAHTHRYRPRGRAGARNQPAPMPQLRP